MNETLREMMATIRADMGHMRGDIGEIKLTLNGNGQDGLLREVDRNTQWRKSWRRWVPSGIALIIAIATVIGLILQYRKEL